MHMACLSDDGSTKFTPLYYRRRDGVYINGVKVDDVDPDQLNQVLKLL